MKFFGRSLYILSILLFYIVIPVKSQYQPPPGIKWYKIKSPDFKIVFPEGLEAEAHQAASLLGFVSGKVPDVYNQPLKPINVYLNNLTIQSNGYVALAPRHMGWNIHASQDVSQLGNSDWFQTLSLHEFRHVIQFDYLNRNFSLIPSSLFGEFGLSFVALWAVPMWYYEGDAISSETLFSHQGRGRLPEFEMEIKAILTGTNQKFSYNQAYLRSYRRYFPNHYHLGYFMHTHVSRNHGIDKWPLIIEKVTKNPFSPYSFSRGLKKNTGVNLNKTYKNTINELTNRWTNDITPLPSEIKPLQSVRNKVYTHYRYGHFLTDSSYLCLKYGMADAPSLVKINSDGKETFVRGINNNMFISSNGKLVAWNTITSDIRWGMRDFSDIMLLNIETGQVKHLTHKGKYLSPSVSPGGSKIAAVRYGENLSYFIDIIDSKTGTILKEFSFSPPALVRTPAWSMDEDRIVYTITSDSATCLAVLDLEDGSSEQLISSSDENIAKPLFWKDYILFVSSARGNNEIHAFNLKNKKRYIALTGGYGFFNPSSSPYNEEIMLESYTSEGYKLFSWIPDTNIFRLFASTNSDKFYISPVLEEGNYTNIFKNYQPADNQYKIKKYHLMTDGLKIHSWAILPSYQGIQGTVFINDPLSIAGISAGIQYNQNEKNALRFFNINYSGLFPLLNAGFSNGRRTNYKSYDNDSGDYYQWYENSVSAKISLPFNLSSEEFIRNLSISGGFGYIFISDLENKYKEEYDMGNGSFGSVNTSISLMVYQQMALRDFYPKAGFRFDAGYYSSITGSDYQGSLFSVSATRYLGGLSKHHSLRLHLAFEMQNPGSDSYSGYIYSSKFLFFRGYENIFTEKITKFSGDYAFPIAYPDLGLGSLIYLKRIRANFFADYGYGITGDFKKKYLSAGTDVLFDINIFRFLPEFDIGMRLVVTEEKNISATVIVFQKFEY